MPKSAPLRLSPPIELGPGTAARCSAEVFSAIEAAFEKMGTLMQCLDRGSTNVPSSRKGRLGREELEESLYVLEGVIEGLGLLGNMTHNWKGLICRSAG